MAKTYFRATLLLECKDSELSEDDIIDLLTNKSFSGCKVNNVEAVETVDEQDVEDDEDIDLDDEDEEDDASADKKAEKEEESDL